MREGGPSVCAQSSAARTSGLIIIITINMIHIRHTINNNINISMIINFNIIIIISIISIINYYTYYQSYYGLGGPRREGARPLRQRRGDGRQSPCAAYISLSLSLYMYVYIYIYMYIYI